MIGEQQMVKSYAIANKCVRLQARRWISIQPVSKVVVDAKKADVVPVSENVPDLNSESHEIPTEVVFETIGQSQSTLSLTVPPSVPIHLKRGSLMSLFTASETKSSLKDVVQSSLQLQEPFKRLVYGGHASLYQRLVSTVPLALLVSAYNPKSLFRTSQTSKTFCNITLDGTIDWALFKTDSLQAYGGNSLVISSQRLPQTVSRSGIQAFGLPKGSVPGLSKRPFSGFEHVAGRGFVSLVGEGSIFKLNLEEDEEILIRRDNLFAASIKQKQDLQDGYFVLQTLTRHLETGEREIVIDSEGKKTFFVKAGDYVLDLLKAFKEKRQSWFENVIGNGSYINVKGPRILLIQANTGSDKFSLGQNYNVSKIEKYIKKDEFQQPKLVPSSDTKA
ncbi:hypothetical protein OGAPHI_005662 [Ogataea philodendri]|uniref:Altered inheritance of mitochondria protein 24, mitochondrial n=1 Tax=Ogataea philodendri TaxID=1378263 RepID=A0A9P8NZL7_9ASCO|nr:uncharacterized protein OGAPHI_005662 [Ogataea philodendri]KAH3662410.1 hypothetical protein OGAPHI_005662 [Ogataea philodendri]